MERNKTQKKRTDLLVVMVCGIVLITGVVGFLVGNRTTSSPAIPSTSTPTLVKSIDCMIIIQGTYANYLNVTLANNCNGMRLQGFLTVTFGGVEPYSRQYDLQPNMVSYFIFRPMRLLADYGSIAVTA